MPIVSTDIIYRLSTTAGTAGNTVVAGAPGTSLGKYMSTSSILDGVTDNVFPDITGDENAASNIDYQCVFVYNSNATLTLQNAVIWLAAEIVGGANVAIALDSVGAVAAGSTAAQATTITGKNVTPSPVGVFSSPTTKAAGLLIGNLNPGQVYAVWIRRSATNSPSQSSDGVTLRIEGDTVA